MMGSQAAQDMAEVGGVNEVTMTWHLRSNHYPPHPSFMIPFALEAVEALNEEDEDRSIDLPDGAEFRDGRTALPAWEIADALHLWDFVAAGSEVEL